MTNYRRVSNRHLMEASGQFIPIVGIGDVNVVFMHPSDVRLFRVIQFTDVFHIWDLDSNFFALRAMKTKRFSFHARNSKISLFSGKLAFPVKDTLY